MLSAARDYFSLLHRLNGTIFQVIKTFSKNFWSFFFSGFSVATAHLLSFNMKVHFRSRYNTASIVKVPFNNRENQSHRFVMRYSALLFSMPTFVRNKMWIKLYHLFSYQRLSERKQIKVQDDVFLIKAALMKRKQAKYALRNHQSYCQSKWLCTQL